MNNLANSYRSAHEWPIQFQCFHKETLEGCGATLEPNHPNLLNCMSNLAIDYSDAGRLDDAIRVQEEALRLKQDNPGPEHPDTLRTRDALAAAYHRGGRTAQAIALQEETVKLAKRKMALEHPHALLFKSNLAEMYSAAGRWSEAVPMHEEVYKLARAKLGLDHPETLNFLDRLANAYLETRRWSDAEGLLRESLRIQESKRADDWLRFQSMSRLGAALVGQKKLAEAAPLLIQGYEGMKAREAKIPAHSKKNLATAAGRIVLLYEAWGKTAEAAEWRAKAGLPEAVATPKR